MKFAAATILLLSALSSPSADAYNNRVRGLEYDNQEGNFLGRKLQKKKDLNKGKKKGGEKDGGKKDGGKKDGRPGDCTDGAEPIVSCFTELSDPGRYVLDGNLNCGGALFGIAITANDVHLDCQGNQIRGNDSTIGNIFGIGVSGATKVTVSNCVASNFQFGLRADNTIGPWSDLVVRQSTFNDNLRTGMSFIGVVDSPGSITVVDSTAIGNGIGEESFTGAGLGVINVEGTISGVLVTDNFGPDASGIVAIDSNAFTLIDVTANSNSNAGIVSISADIAVINSIACGNGNEDIFTFGTGTIDTAQANTCGMSTPEFVNTFRVCQCLCDGSSPGGSGVTVGGEGDPTGWLTSPIFSNDGEFSIAAAVYS
jgi:hypothetical protein